MSPFHFRKLPLLAQKGILRQCEVLTLIELSFVSKKFKRFLQNVEIEVESFWYNLTSSLCNLNVDSSSDTLSIYLYRYCCNNFEGKWNTNGNALHILKRLKYSVGSEKCTNGWGLETLEKLTKYLLSFIKVKNFKLDFNGHMYISNLFIWKYSQCFDTIIINRVHSTPSELTPSELAFLLKNLTINYLYLNVRIRNVPNFKCYFQNQGSSKIRKIEIKNPSWLNYDHLLDLANESISCHIPEEFSRKSNELLKKWMAGTNETLEKLALLASRGAEIVNEQVLEGINATPSVFKENELRKRNDFRVCGLWPSSCITMDIRREHDGCQATLILSRCAVRMFVWNKKHLEVVGRLNLN